MAAPETSGGASSCSSLQVLVTRMNGNCKFKLTPLRSLGTDHYFLWGRGWKMLREGSKSYQVKERMEKMWNDKIQRNSSN